jgi:hypothetical protein
MIFFTPLERCSILLQTLMATQFDALFHGKEAFEQITQACIDMEEKLLDAIEWEII